MVFVSGGLAKFANMKKIIVAIAVLLMAGTAASAQGGYLKNLGERTKNSIDNKVNNRVEGKVDETVDKALDRIFNGKKKTETEAEQPAAKKAGATWTCEECGKTGNTGKFCADCGAKQPAAEAPAGWTCEECGKAGNTGKFCSDCGAKKPGDEAAGAAPKPAAAAPAKPKKQTETAYAKSDFVPGDDIFFEDTFEHEKLGEFPLRWDLLSGYAETVTIEGRKCIGFTDDGSGYIQPLMKEENYLPDVFTIEFDLFVNDASELGANGVGEHTFWMELLTADGGAAANVGFWFRTGDGGSTIRWGAWNPSDIEVSGEKELHVGEDGSLKSLLKLGDWNHFSYSFNKRAFKGYVNGTRVINIPNMRPPARVRFMNGGQYKYNSLSNVRIAQGAVPLYDRLLSDGKIVTYAITFELGKADLKPESMVEITRVAKLMQEYPNLEFEVQGHCDASGSDKVNDPLSQKRAEAIVAALVEQGIASARLTAVGKGSHSPIADNKTEEGRAKNRRVEFVKK